MRATYASFFFIYHPDSRVDVSDIENRRNEVFVISLYNKQYEQYNLVGHLALSDLRLMW
jgi:hypothetical protein